ncbi:MAG: carbon-nitrogen family hydrolase, partial [Clostridia bacterium]
MRISCIQMDMRLGDNAYNYAHAEALVRQAVKAEQPDVVVLPETWNTGFFPKEHLEDCADTDGKQTKQIFSALAAELNVNIVAGSVANRRGEQIFNTALVFNRTGACIAEYDKTHLFVPMGEDHAFSKGKSLCWFSLDGVRCAIIICYEVRFPEYVRTLALPGLDVLFVVSQWLDKRISHLQVLTQARAIENQMFVVLCNSCGRAGNTQYGGYSAVIDPMGVVLAQAGAEEMVL